MHHALSTVTKDDPAVFTNFMINTLGVTNHKIIDVIKNSVVSFGELLAVNDGDIDTFVTYTHSTNDYRAVAHRILISNIHYPRTQIHGFELYDRELCNAFPDEVALHGINAYTCSIMRKNRADAK